MKMSTLLLIFLSCQLSFTQSLNKEINNKGERPYLLGKINKEGLTQQNYNTWFTKQYDDYQFKKETISEISNNLKSYTITLFMGTWCGDSRREVPRFYKILEAANYPMEKLTAVAVSGKPTMYKQSPNHEEKGLNIHRVPTFIFYKDGVEVNRIVESPVVSLEEDIQSILNNNYKSNYVTVTKVDKMLEELGIKKFKQKAEKQIPTFKNEVKNMYELNTYARILTSTNRTEEAIEILKLNTKLFPEKSGVFVSLANTYYGMNNKNDALNNYKKGLELNPDNDKLKATIQRLKNNN